MLLQRFPNISPNSDPSLAPFGALSARQASTPTPHLREGLQGDLASKMAIAASPRRLRAQCFSGSKITPFREFFKTRPDHPVARVSSALQAFCVAPQKSDARPPAAVGDSRADKCRRGSQTT
jgi:hypothetical protein